MSKAAEDQLQHIADEPDDCFVFADHPRSAADSDWDNERIFFAAFGEVTM